MELATLLLELDGGVARVSLNRPQVLNALNRRMAEELNWVVAELKKQEDLRVVVLAGAGRAFCAGGDIEDIARVPDALSFRQLVTRTNEAIIGLAELEVPVIARVHGHAVGAGCNIALAADVIVASEDAVFGELFVRVGLIPDAGGTYILPRLVGIAKAKELVFTGDTFSAKTALEMGLINRVTPADQLDVEIEHLVAKIRNGPTRAIGLAKKIMNRGLNQDMVSVLEYEAYAQALCAQTEDFKEGAAAFQEKRRPVFKGR